MSSDFRRVVVQMSTQLFFEFIGTDECLYLGDPSQIEIVAIAANEYEILSRIFHVHFESEWFDPVAEGAYPPTVTLEHVHQLAMEHLEDLDEEGADD